MQFYRSCELIVSKNHHFLRQNLLNKTIRSDFIAGYRLLTVCRVRDIRAASSECPASTDNGDWAKLPENPAKIALSGQKGLLING
jgi:hypothetical protein